MKTLIGYFSHPAMVPAYMHAKHPGKAYNVETLRHGVKVTFA